MAAIEKKDDFMGVAVQDEDITKHDAEHTGAKRDYSGAVLEQSPEEKALVRKLDYRIMVCLKCSSASSSLSRWPTHGSPSFIAITLPNRIQPIIWLMFWLNYLDRNAIALAKLDDVDEDLGLSPTQYSTCVSILFVGYILGGIPSNMLITRIRPSYYLGSAMVLWAIVSTLTGISKNFTGLLLTRFFLGVTEAPFYPGALYLLSIFYTRKEVALRISVLYTGNILATAFAGLIAIGVFKLDGAAGLEGWRWLFIIQGLVTFFVAILGGYLLPDDPTVTRWLTPEERILANNRIKADTVEEQGKISTIKGLKEALKDYRVWIFVFMQHMHLASNGKFAPIPLVSRSRLNNS